MGLGMRIRALVAVVGLLLTALAVDALAATQVRSVRLWRAPDNTRLVFDLSGPVQHSVFTLTAPDRLVIDINGATLGGPLNVSTANTPITAMRSAQRTPTDLRVVVDLKKAVTPKSFTLAPNAQYGNRLVVDLFDNPADAAPTPPPAPNVATVPAVPVTPTKPEIKLPPAPAGKRDIVVVIDAGHGGEDPGASGSRGQHEKDVVLAIARELQRQINGLKGFRAELTRTGDYFIRCAVVPRSPARKAPTCSSRSTPTRHRPVQPSGPRCSRSPTAAPRPRRPVGWRTAKTVPT